MKVQRCSFSYVNRYIDNEIARYITPIRKLARIWLVSCALSIYSGLVQANGSVFDFKDKEYQIDITEMNVVDALNQLSVQTGVSMLFPYRLAKSRKANAVKGRYTIEKALQRLLNQSGLVSDFTDDGVINIFVKEVGRNNTDERNGMNTKKNILATAVALYLGTGSVSDSVAQSESFDWTLEEIIVTAQKRGAESLLDTPISMGVLNGDDFEASGIRDFSEVLNGIGGVNLYSESPGQTTISIRGAGNEALFAGGSTSGFYLDEIPFGFLRSGVLPDANVYDMERVEVLRGPQGTLYGASSLNGTVRILTKDANLDGFEFKARSGFSHTQGGEESYSGDFAVNVPLIPGKLALRGVVSYADNSGWVDTTSDNVIDQIPEDNINDSDTGSYRLKVNAQPTDRLSIEAGVWVSRLNFDAPSNSSSRNYITEFSADQSAQQDFDIYNFEINYDFDSFSLVSSTSYMEYSQDSLVDFKISGVIPVKISPYENYSEAYNQEVRLVSTGDGPWQWSTGFSYREAEEYLRQGVIGVLPGVGEAQDESQSWAAFGEVTRKLMDERLNLTLGVRYFENDQELIEYENLFLARPLFEELEESFDDWSPRVVLTYFPDDETTLYVSASKGFRTGIIQGPSAMRQDPSVEKVINPDSLWNYEFGLKGTLLDGRLRYDSALYYINWEDVQQLSFTPVGTAAIRNTGDASGFGLDLSLTTQPLEGLLLGFNLGWSGLEFDENIEPIPGLTMFSEGDRLNQSPEYTVGLSAEYLFSFSDELEGRFTLASNYHSELTIQSVSGLSLYESESDTILNTRVSFSIDSDQWGGMLFADNVTNEDGATSAYPNGRIPARLRPRTVGLQVTYHY